ncbi:MAG: UDP-N-acetylmuramate dehydrogenase [Muribaculaceae bacterium]|nr:UDP-N-acetylmuramate dehydrogenase [Muribaculaceae bacterium]
MSFTIEKNKELKDITSFHISAKADYYATYSTAEELRKLSMTEEFLNNEILNLGEGCNVLFAGDFHGMILHSCIKGFKRYDKDEETVFAIAGAGEKWDDFVNWTIGEGLGGVENLAGIPGSVGAAPVQNIGAYGCEVGSVIHNVECFDVITRQTVTLKGDECGFGYRDSIFKKEGKGRYIVLRVSFRMKKSDKAANLTYGPLADLEKRIQHAPTIHEVADEIRKIRAAKLPDPDVIGNTGSFFKNPVVRIYFYKEVMSVLDPDIPYYETDTPPYVKIPAGWLIEHAGLKGYRIGGAEIYPGQCLVIANRGGATSEDVLKLSDFVVREVKRKFGVTLQPEVNIIDTKIKVTILGSGTSKGIPEVGCYCPVCTSDAKEDKRMRCSALVETGGMKILIDVSPDFRQQALNADISVLDAALITHNHYDHVGGFDDLRPFCALGKFPVYLRKDVNSDLHHRLDYCFKDHLYPGVPSFEMHEIENSPFLINGLKVIPVTVMHGKVPIVGYRIGDFAYLTDVKTIPEEEMEKLEGLDVLVLNALRYKDHFAHLTLDEALALIQEIKPKKTYLTHFCHEIGKHAELLKKLPDNVLPCYDGLTFITH